MGRTLTLRAKAKGLEAVRAFGSLGCDMPTFMKVSVCTSQAVACHHHRDFGFNVDYRDVSRTERPQRHT
jgi:hypothetical protein